MKEKIEFDAEELTLISLAKEYSDETKARELFESIRWPNGPVCPHCKCDDVYTLKSKETTKRKVRPGLYSCAACRKPFTATMGTVLEDSHLPLSKWLMAFYILCSSKKSISAHQMHRMLGITYKTSWFMCHRIRHVMRPNSDTPKLTGTVEVDETFVGGKGDPRTKLLRKTPVVALVQRDGVMRTAVVSNVTQKNLKAAIAECVDKGATINTDDSTVYRNKLKDYARHDVVVHSKFEYVRHNPDGTYSGVNHCESFFSLLKRGVVGSWHHVSREHLPKYANEFEFRWNHRKVSDGERMVAAVGMTEGKRLTYKQAV